jgi:hypothetical protein
MKDLESYNHEHRQKIMRDFELINLREADLEKQKKINEVNKKSKEITNFNKKIKKLIF